jgi:hypothetical protein
MARFECNGIAARRGDVEATDASPRATEFDVKQE